MDIGTDPFPLHLANIHKSFGSVEVLRGIDLKIDSGERVALMGPSGSGKSTLLNCICGIETVDEGEICMDGEDLGKLSSRDLERLRREKVGYVFQSFHLLPTLNAFENVEFSAQLAGMNKNDREERVNELLKLVGIEHRLNHLPDTLSGGERQRVAIARALIHRPKLVLADEPTGNLDEATGDATFALMRELVAESGAGLIMATHSNRLAVQLGRQLHLSGGRLT